MTPKTASSLLSALVLVAAGVALFPAPAAAGIPECGNIRLEEVRACELRADVECSAGCDRLGIYETACATRLHTVCRETCTIAPEATCTDSCTVGCQTECDAGVSITCQHNCFGECQGSCTTTCAGAANVERCTASCRATCDGECDIRCAPVVDAGCYTHCVECCGGSCTAQANMNCQTDCQDVAFEECEHEFQASCSASCSADGALFCDDQFVVSGAQLPACVEALVALGVAGLNVEATCEIGAGGADCVAEAGACSVIAPGSKSGGGAAILLGLMWLALARRRRSR